MARSFTSKDAKAIIQECVSLRDKLQGVCHYSLMQKKALVSLTDELLAGNVFSDIVMKDLVSGTADTSVPRSLRPMLAALYKYTEAYPHTKQAARLTAEHSKEIDLEISRLKPAANGIQWLFTGGKNKILAEEAYARLCDILDNGFRTQVNEITEAVAAIERTDTDAAAACFESDRSGYLDALLDIVPNAPAKGRPAQPIAQLIKIHETLIERINAVEQAPGTTAAQIKSIADRMIAGEALKTLEGIPVEELGREKSGIRFKALRDHGFESVSDVYCATVYNLASVHGISEDTARLLKQYARQYVEETKPGSHLRLSFDDQNEDATKLVSAVYLYRKRTALADTLNGPVRDSRQQAVSALEQVRDIADGFFWPFMSQDERKTYISAYRYLNELLEDEYARQANAAHRALTDLSYADPAAAWEDFRENSIACFNVLEGLVPGILGNSDTWFGLPEDLAREIQDEIIFPDGLKCSLRRYQEWGVKYILHQERVLLGDEMGLGKTIQAIAAMVSLKNTGATHFLVVCPASVLPNWCKEVAAKSMLRVTKIHGRNRTAAFKDWQENGGVAVTNFETTGHLKMDDGFSFDMMVVDEAHYIKNTETKRTQNVISISGHTKRLLFMTGTALENNVDEMIALVRILKPEIALQLKGIAFLASAQQFREKIATVYYRRKREDVLTELPELIENKEWCELSPAEKSVYEKAVLSKRFMDIRRVSWNVENIADSCKAKRLMEIVEDAREDGRKVIVFSFFLETVSQIRTLLGERCLPPINGSIHPQRRQAIIDEFDKAPAGSVLLAQIQSGGTGLNIQTASVVIMCEPQLKPSIENQAISRAYRMGQARNVLVYRLLCENTVDERIIEMLESKQTVFDAFADTSVSADATAREDAAIDDATLGRIIQEEIERITSGNSEEDSIDETSVLPEGTADGSDPE